MVVVAVPIVVAVDHDQRDGRMPPSLERKDVTLM